MLAAAKAGRGKWNRYAPVKRDETRLVALIARSKKIRPVGAMHLRCHWREPNRRRNPDNFVGGGRKMILDGLVMAGVLRNDGWGEVLSFTDTWGVDSKHPGVEVTIMEAAQPP